jgi:hypothetical protein
MSHSFTKKILEVRFTLGQGDFGAQTGNTVILRGLRTDAEITKGGHPSKNQLKLKIYGMLEHDMDMLAKIPFKSMAVRKNLVQVQAGDEDGMSVAFQGEITGAWAVYKSPPGLYFHVDAVEGYYPTIAPSSPKSYRGSTSVDSLMSALAKEMGIAYENTGVKTMIASPYLSGSAYQQAAQIADAADIEFGVDDGTLFIAPRGKARKGQAPVISADTGMKEYPVFDKKGLEVECLYNPAVTLGGLISVKSMLKVATGTWRVHGLRHHLQAEHPGGSWTTKITASPVEGSTSTASASEGGGEE